MGLQQRRHDGLFGHPLRQHALPARDVDHPQSCCEPRCLEILGQGFGLGEQALGQAVDVAEALERRRFGEGAFQDRPGCRYAVDEIAEGRLRERLGQYAEIVLGLGDRAPAEVRRPFRCDVGAHQSVEFDDPLRQHAELAGAVDRIGVARRVDDLLGDLTDALLRLHRSGSQHAKRFFLRDVTHSHHDAFGPIDEFALAEPVVDVRQFVAKRLLVAEPRLRNVNDGAQTIRPVAVDHIGMDPRCGGALDLLRVRISGEHHDRARGGGLQSGRDRKEGIARVTFIADEHIRGSPDHVLHHGLESHGAVHADADGFEVGLQRRSVATAGGEHAGRCHRSIQSGIAGAKGEAMRFAGTKCA